MVATLADGTSQVAWSETALVHVTPLDANQQRRVRIIGKCRKEQVRIVAAGVAAEPENRRCGTVYL